MTKSQKKMITATATAIAMCSYLILLSLDIITIITTCSSPIPNPFMHTSCGDCSYEFQWCLAKSTQGTCLMANGSGSGHPNALTLHLMHWMCMDKYKYICTHAVMDLALEGGMRVE
jgi:hypothetical protein